MVLDPSAHRHSLVDIVPKVHEDCDEVKRIEKFLSVQRVSNVDFSGLEFRVTGLLVIHGDFNCPINK